MKKQALAIAIAAALVAPSAFAAQDTSGMQFTSASEGFYASMRARLDFSGNKDQTAHIESNSSRIGIRGSNDLGAGLSGFYQWELGVNIDGGSSAGSTRLGHVGLRGDFGEFIVGSFWANDYNWTHGSTDVANNYSGFLVYGDDREGRASESLQYTTPDLNGFQGALRFRLNGGGGDPFVPETENDLDAWNIAAQYAIQGFTVAGSYQTRADALAAQSARTDLGDDNEISDIGTNNDDDTLESLASGDDETWTIRLGYAQDNWYVNGWYGESNAQSSTAASNEVDAVAGVVEDPNTLASEFVAAVAQVDPMDGRIHNTDEEVFSIAGGVAIDKVNLYGVYETRDNSGGVSGSEANYGTLGVQYNLGAQSRVWIEYFSQDVDASPGAEDIISVGLRHDF